MNILGRISHWLRGRYLKKQDRQELGYMRAMNPWNTMDKTLISIHILNTSPYRSLDK